MKLAVRMDDITPDMDWEKFERFRSLLEKYHIMPLIGVVPLSRDDSLHLSEPREDFWEIVRDLQSSGWVVAMHGCYHVYTTKKGGLIPLNHLSEFAGLPYEKQDELIRSGKEALAGRGIRTQLFMAPAHSFDSGTLHALRENGFTGVTDGFGDRLYRRAGLTFYPISFDRKKTLRETKTNSVSTLVVHANTMNDNEFRQYEEIFRTHEMISYSELLAMPAAELGFFGGVRQFCMAFAKRAVMDLVVSSRS